LHPDMILFMCILKWAVEVHAQYYMTSY